MCICQIITACILATQMDKATGTMPDAAGKTVLAFICLFVAGKLDSLTMHLNNSKHMDSKGFTSAVCCLIAHVPSFKSPAAYMKALKQQLSRPHCSLVWCSIDLSLWLVFCACCLLLIVFMFLITDWPVWLCNIDLSEWLVFSACSLLLLVLMFWIVLMF